MLRRWGFRAAVVPLAAATLTLAAPAPAGAVPAPAPPTIGAVFVPDTVPANGVSTASFTLSNPNDVNSQAGAVTLTGVAFTDSLPAGLAVASPNGASSDCGGTLTAVAGSSSITLSGATIEPFDPNLDTGGTCNVSVEIQAAGPGSFDNTTGPVTATESGDGAPSNTATLTVGPVVAPPMLAKAFTASSIPRGGSTTLTFTVTNPNSSTDLLNVAFDDSLPAGLVVASPNGLGGTCLTDFGGSVSALAGSDTVSLSAVDLTPSSGCSFSVDVTGTGGGDLTNTTGPVQGDYDDGAGSFVHIIGATASASLTVVAPPALAAYFVPTAIGSGGSSALTFTVTNPNPSTALHAIGFTDPLPSGLSVAPAGASGSCGGGTITAASGSGSIQLAGAALPAYASCTFSVQVTGSSEGRYDDATGTVSSEEVPTPGPGATATLYISTPPVIGVSFGAASVLVGSLTSLSFTIQNPNSVLTLTGLAFHDQLPAGLVVASPSGLSGSCGGSVTAAPGSASVALAGGTLAPGASCTISVSVTGTSPGVKSDSTGPVIANEAPAGSSASASLTVNAPPNSPGPPSNLFTISHVKGSAKTGVVTFDLTLPGAGSVDVLESAWNSTLAHAAAALAPGRHRYAFARQSRSFRSGGTFSLRVKPGANGRKAVRLNKRGLLINLWITYTPTGGTARTRAVLHLRLRP